MICKGETVWLENGQECTYLGAAGDGHIVEPCLDFEDGDEPAAGEQMLVRAVFSSAPHIRCHADIEKGRAELSALRQETRAAREEHRKTETLKADTLKSLAEVEALRRIQDFIDGKITHFLGTPWGARLITFEEAMHSQDEYTHRPNPIKLLCLFGDSEGVLSWKINMYHDGSGSWKEWRPFTSYDDAKAALAEYVAEEFAKYLAGDRVLYLNELVQECDKHGVPVPRDVLDKAELARRKEIKGRIEKHESEMVELRKQLGVDPSGG